MAEGKHNACMHTGIQPGNTILVTEFQMPLACPIQSGYAYLGMLLKVTIFKQEIHNSNVKVPMSLITSHLNYSGHI